MERQNDLSAVGHGAIASHSVRQYRRDGILQLRCVTRQCECLTHGVAY
jgi:hypothetical protein